MEVALMDQYVQARAEDSLQGGFPQTCKWNMPFSLQSCLLPNSVFYLAESVHAAHFTGRAGWPNPIWSPKACNLFFTET
jgi:hypothetical protein